MMRIDARLPIRFGPLESRRAGEAVLLDSPASIDGPAIAITPGSPGHVADCACCAPRSAAARALADLFRQRAIGPGPAFAAVLAAVSRDSEDAIMTALREDVVVAARYRLDPTEG